MPNRAKVSNEQRGEAVLRLLRKEGTAHTIARDLGVSEPTLYQWREKFLASGFKGLSGKGGGGVDEEQRQREMAQLHQVIGELTVANNVLKKNLGISS